ncbi:hypothetical protein LTR86_010601, partial [Recurvomyces mirabilis]
ERVVFLKAVFDEKHLGLNENDYSRLGSEVNLVFHNTWPMDFNRNFSSFKPSVDGVQNLIDFCIGRHEDKDINQTPAGSGQDRPSPIKFLFISSIGATSNWGSAAPTSRAEIPEVELTDWKVARTGYGQSKLLCERLLAHAAQTSSLLVTVVRVGQLAGPVMHGEQGKWPEQEWLPSLVRSSMALGSLPETLGPADIVDWVPVDVAAQVLIELLEAFSVRKRGAKSNRAQFFHLVNPHAASWADIAPFVKQSMHADVQLVPFVDWVDRLKASTSEAGGFRGVDEGINPAAKLIDFFDNLQDKAIRFPKTKSSRLDTKDTVKVSLTLAQLQPVTAEWMAMWMKQWTW